MPQSIPFFMYGTSAAVPDLFHCTRFEAPDPVCAVKWPDGSVTLLVGDMEFGRARNQTRGIEVVSPGSLAASSARAGRGGRAAAPVGAVTFAARWLARERGVRAVAVDRAFPIGAAETLKQAKIAVKVVGESPVAAARAVKTPDEIRAIRASQSAARAAERALGAAIRRCTAGRGGELVLDGRPFTSERARSLVRAQLLMRGAMDFEGSIVAGGAQAACPHEQGSGPLRSGEWIVADIFPRSLRTGYWGDMTRTFAHGRPDAPRRRLYKTVREAHALGISLVRPGVTGASVHEAVAEFFARAGYERGADSSGAPHGFIHGLGHGVGLEIHEEPRLSPSGRDELRPGMVVTVEPGLYYPDLGGVRIEDTVLVTETGCMIL